MSPFYFAKNRHAEAIIIDKFRLYCTIDNYWIKLNEIEHAAIENLFEIIGNDLAQKEVQQLDAWVKKNTKLSYQTGEYGVILKFRIKKQSLVSYNIVVDPEDIIFTNTGAA